MRIKNFIIAVMASAAMMVGCEKPEVITGDASVSLNPETLTFTQEASELTIEITATRDWTIKNSSEWITEVTPSEGTASSKPQKVTITVAANEGKNRTAEIKFRAGVAAATLTVTQEGPLGEDKPIEEGDGTKEHPYNATQAHNIAAALASGATTDAPVYIKGKIHKLHSKHTAETISTYGNGSFYISDDGNSSDTDFLCYQVYYLGNTKFTSVDQVKVGDEVLIYGKITNYNGTCETVGQGAAYICQINDGEFNDGSVNEEEVESKTVADFIAAADTDTFYKLTGTVSSYKYGSYMTFDLTDETGKIYIYQITNQTDWKDKISDGGTVSLIGKYAYYEKNKQHEVVSAQILSFETYEGQDINTEKVSEVISAKDGDNITLSNALVVATAASGYLVTDGTDYVLSYYKETATETIPSVGDIVTIKATKSSYGDMAQLVNPETTIASSDNEVNYPEAEDITSSFDSFTSTAVKYVTLTGSLKIDGNYYNVNVDGASTNVGAFLAPSFDVAGFDGVAGAVYTGYYIYTTSGKYVYLILTSVSMPDGPYFIVTPESANVDAAGGEVEIAVNANVAWSASSDNEAFTLDNNSGEGSATIKVTVAENTAFESRTANITITTEAEVTTKTYTVAIKQAAAADPNAKVLELTNDEIKALGSSITQNGYQEVNINSESGSWYGKINASKTMTFLQIRNQQASCIKSPEFSSNISKVVLTLAANKNVGQKRVFRALPIDTELYQDKDEYYDDSIFGEDNANVYGVATDSGSATTSATGEVTIDFTKDANSFMLVVSQEDNSKSGAAYIDAIKVYLK